MFRKIAAQYDLRIMVFQKKLSLSLNVSLGVFFLFGKEGVRGMKNPGKIEYVQKIDSYALLNIFHC